VYCIAGSFDDDINPHSLDALNFDAACMIQIQRSAAYPGLSEPALMNPAGKLNDAVAGILVRTRAHVVSVLQQLPEIYA
jgi:hypothetical protein